MSRNSKTQAGGAWVSQKNLPKQSDKKYNKRLPSIQPGTALTAFLKRYKFDLLSLPHDNHISRLVDAADILLDEVGGTDAEY